MSPSGKAQDFDSCIPMVRTHPPQPDAEYDYPSTENSPLVAQNTRAQTKKEFIKNYLLNYLDTKTCKGENRHA